MEAGSRPKILTGCIAARITPEEEALVRQRAEAAGLSPSEWARRALTAVASTSPETRLLLEQIEALRVVVTALLSLSPGITHSLIDKSVAHAEATRSAKAAGVISAFETAFTRGSPG